MGNNTKFKQFCGCINYNTYANIRKVLGLSGVGIAFFNELILPQSPMLNNSANILAIVSSVAYLGLVWSHGINYTKDTTQIRELYQEFIKNYNKLNKIFDLNDPIQIYTMFNYLLYKGYLSKDKEFQFSDKQSRDIDGLGGTNVIVGKAVCRHISAMLTDILNGYGIETSQLRVYFRNYSININFLDEPKYTKDELISWVRNNITNEQTYDSVMRLIEELVDKKNQNIEIYSEIIEDKNPLKRKTGNHAISFAIKDGKSYFLDPTQSRIYRMNSDTGILYDDECDVPIRTKSSRLSNNSKGYLRMKENLSSQYPSVSREEEKEIIATTMDICEDNIDVFEQFYTENSELYSDISSKLLKIKKRKSIIK